MDIAHIHQSMLRPVRRGTSSEWRAPILLQPVRPNFARIFLDLLQSTYPSFLFVFPAIHPYNHIRRNLDIRDCYTCGSNSVSFPNCVLRLLLHRKIVDRIFRNGRHMSCSEIVLTRLKLLKEPLVRFELTAS